MSPNENLGMAKTKKKNNILEQLQEALSVKQTELQQLI